MFQFHSQATTLARRGWCCPVQYFVQGPSRSVDGRNPNYPWAPSTEICRDVRFSFNKIHLSNNLRAADIELLVDTLKQDNYDVSEVSLLKIGGRGSNASFPTKLVLIGRTKSLQRKVEQDSTMKSCIGSRKRWSKANPSSNTQNKYIVSSSPMSRKRLKRQRKQPNYIQAVYKKGKDCRNH